MFAHPLMSVFIALLFFALTPGVLLSLPKKGSLKTKAAVHGVVFAVVFYFIQKPVMNFLYSEGFQQPSAAAAAAAKAAAEKGKAGVDVKGAGGRVEGPKSMADRNASNKPAPPKR